MSMILLKAHNKGYVKKDGTVVKPFDDKRHPKQHSFFSGYLKHKDSGKVIIPSHSGNVSAPQAKKESGFGLFSAMQKHYQNAVAHPAKGESGKTIKINEPTTPSAPETWADKNAAAVFVPGGDVPDVLNGVAIAPWTDHPRRDEDWDYVDGQTDDLEEPPMHLPLGLKAASGCVIEEPDGRVWLVSPTNGFGYDTTYPKGKAEDDLSLQANAIKEAFEESGLKVEITGLLGDFQRTTSVTRLYTARRVGGSPSAVGWESQAVRLVPRSALDEIASADADAPINQLLKP
jgi:ADP-ribose pyrophosphatase YjhB (NUDIX family)